MKKFLFLTIVFCVSVFAVDEYKQTLEKAIFSVNKMQLKVLSVDELKSTKSLKFVTAQVPDGRRIPFYASEDGKSFIGFSGLLYFSVSQDMDLIKNRIAELDTYNKKIQKNAEEKTKKETEKKINDLLATLPKESFLQIGSNVKTDKVLTIITDPDCPYCRKELDMIEERLKDSNVRLVFAPVHDEKAFIKSQLILTEAKNLKPEQAKEIIEIVRKYYKNMPLDQEQMNTDTKLIHENTKKIFGSGLVRGVPFLVESK
jgi:thiol:disulfide interchange protein DsbC